VPIRIALIALAVILAVYAAELVLDFLPAGGTELFQKFATNVVFMGSATLCAIRAFTVPGERAAWLLMAAGLFAWGLGGLYYTLYQWNLAEVPIPSPADAGWLLFYPPVYVALVLLFRARVRGRDSTLWIDGATGALAIGAFGAAIVFGTVLDSTGGAAATVATNITYPLADLLMLGLVVIVLAMTGWRRAGAWGWIAGGLAVFSVADGFYLYGTAVGSYESGAVYDSGWPAAALLVAFGAWSPASPIQAKDASTWRAIALPIGFALASLGLLIYDHFERTNMVALVLASLCLVAVLVRLVITFGDNLRMLTASRVEARTDPLTGLGNRRLLTVDLESLALRATTRAPVSLLMFDLDGFKSYNDTFGHPAGDSLLARLGHALKWDIGFQNTAYRIGGDEFCVLATPADGDVAGVLKRATKALSERGEGFSITCSYGAVQIPQEAQDTEKALGLADARMYLQKNGGRASAGRQSSDVLLRALSERHPSLAEHLSGVTELALDVGERLGLATDALEDLRLAAELHDIGKVAIPDAILSKRGPLDEAEWEFMRGHTIVGERILQGAPALQRVAGLVRATHERMDGEGYPDRLPGREIPIAARIVGACDAFDAMTSDRSYRSAMSIEVAMAELDRCSGTQFDPVVVAAVHEAVAQTSGRPAGDHATRRAAAGSPSA
jgi:diguanylate cyclase (GGDEF)-like protein